MKSTLHIHPQKNKKKGNQYLRSCILKEKDSKGKISEYELWYLLPDSIVSPGEKDCEAYLLASIMYAMKKNFNIIIHGSVSLELLSNLTELQLVWHNWCPGLYSLIDIEVEDIVEITTKTEGAICAFSGGVDSSFTAYRHSKNYAGYATKNLKAGLLVHGFDIDLSNEIDFLSAYNKSRESLTDLGLDTHAVKTNTKDLFNRKLKLDWEHSHGLAIASVMNNFKKYASMGLLGSGEPYSSLQAPWGSHPITDPLFSSHDFRIIHDGAGFDRTEKVELIAKWDIGRKNLRVCWQGQNQDANCGICEKCIRTRLNFILAGLNHPECFPNELKKRDFNAISLRNSFTMIEWRLIKSKILKSGAGIEYLSSVEKVIKRKPPKAKFEILLPINSKRRKFIKKLIK